MNYSNLAVVQDWKPSTRCQGSAVWHVQPVHHGNLPMSTTTLRIVQG